MPVKPLVSVWIITYNQEKYIAEAIESALQQKTDFSFEIVIGEDCSTDRTREIVLSYKKRFPEKIRLVLHKENMGMVANQNHTFNACRGQYIALLEGDDYWNSDDKLQKQLDLMQAHPQCELSFHPVYTTKDTTLNNYGDHLKIIPIEENIRVGGYFMSTPSIMIKKSILSTIPEFLDAAPAGDYYIQIFGSLKGGALYIPEIMATYRIEAHGSWSQSIYDDTIKIEFIEKTLEIIQKLDQYLDFRYSEAFQYKYMTASMELSTTYLYNNNIQKFQTTIERSADYTTHKSISFLLKYYLRKYPKIVLFLSRVSHKIKKLRQ